MLLLSTSNLRCPRKFFIGSVILATFDLEAFTQPRKNLFAVSAMYRVNHPVVPKVLLICKQKLHFIMSGI